MRKKILLLTTALLIIPLLVLSLAGCAKELTLSVGTPRDGATVTSSPITIRGTVSDAGATVKINDRVVEVDKEGSFTTTIEPLEGKNIINITATRDDKTINKTITVTYTPEIPEVPELSLEITSPEHGAELTEGTIVVNGNVSDATANVIVNGVKAEVTEDGVFSASIELVEGKNTIEVEAEAEGKASAIRALTVTYTPEAPELSLEIISPEDGAELTGSPVMVSGNVSDASANVTINGVEAEVTEDGTFSASVELTEGENTIEVEATAEGREPVSEIITVTYAPEVPELSLDITAPEDGAELTESPVTVSGNVSDASAKVTVNGIEAEVTEDGTFSIGVELIEGENTIEVEATAEGKAPVIETIIVNYTQSP
jgi:nitrogen fixation protein FixH